jgi:hypothetical protein
MSKWIKRLRSRPRRAAAAKQLTALYNSYGVWGSYGNDQRKDLTV